MRKIFVIVAAVVMISANLPLSAQMQAKRGAAVAASAEVHPVSGGSQFTVSAPSDKAFASVVRFLNLSGSTVESANKDSGLIATAMEIAGGYHQTGTRTVVTVISNSDTETIVRVAVTTQKRFKAIQTEPWSDPKVDAKGSAALLSTLQPAVEADLAKMTVSK